jgi:bifunctional non-homologous end joining protein LigD
VLLDGELVVGQGLPGDFYRLGPRLWAKRSTRPVTFAAFDVLKVDGDAVLDRPYGERRALLVELVPPGPAWTVVPSFTEDPASVFVHCSVSGSKGSWPSGVRRATSQGRGRERG